MDKWRGSSFQSNVTLSSVTLNLEPERSFCSVVFTELLLVIGSLYRKRTLVRSFESEVTGSLTCSELVKLGVVRDD